MELIVYGGVAANVDSPRVFLMRAIREFERELNSPWSADLQDGFTGDLLLDVQVVVLHVLRADIAIEREDIALDATATRRPINGNSTHNRACG